MEQMCRPLRSGMPIFDVIVAVAAVVIVAVGVVVGC